MDRTLAKADSVNRIGWIDCARSLAIIMVVWNHAIETAYDISVDTFLRYSNLSKSFLLNGFHFGRLGVPIFLMITGFLMLSKEYELSFSSSDAHKRSYGQFLRKNYLRLFLCIEIWIIIYFFFYVNYFEIPWDFHDFWNNVLFVDQPHLMHIWYIYMILGLYVILPFVSYLLHNMDLRLLILPFFLTILAYSFLPTLNLLRQISDLPPFNLMVDTFFFGGLYLMYCVMGYLVYKKVFDRIKSIYWVVIGVVFFCLGTELQRYCYENGLLYLIWYNCFTLIPTALSVFVLLSRIRIKSAFVLRCLTDLSKVSFGIYLVHAFFIYLCVDYMELTLSPALTTIVYFAVSLAASYLVVKCISKIPKIGKVLFYM